jgi:hypothetical protein
VLVREVLDTAPKRFGRRWLPSLLRHMASLHLTAGETEEAVAWLQRSLDAALREAVLQHPHAADAMNRLSAEFAASDADTASSLERCGRAIRLLTDLPGQAGASAGAAYTWGLILLADGPHRDLAQAADALGLAVRGFALSVGDAHQFTAEARMRRADCLVRLQQYGKAESLLIHAHTALERTLGKQHPSTLRAVARLAEVRGAHGKPERAAAHADTPAAVAGP